MSLKNAKPPAAGTAGGLAKHQAHAKSIYLDTTTEAQRLRIVVALKQRPQTTEDLRALGIFQAPARVKELRDRDGYVIATDRIALVDREGYIHCRVAPYTLLVEPHGERSQ